MSETKLDSDRMSVMIVDDDAMARGYLRSALCALGYTHVSEVSKAEKVVRMCEIHRPDVVFLDIDLGDRNGIDLIKRLRSVRDGMNIVMVSALSTMENVKGALAQGAGGFIVKPFTIGKVLEALDNARGGYRIDIDDPAATATSTGRDGE